MESREITVPPLQSQHIRAAYERYVELAKSVPADRFVATLLTELTENDVEVWMSGLTCDINPLCRSELRLFVEVLEIPPEVEAVKAESSIVKKHKGADVMSMMTFANKECPPGCNCDNPWPFLS